MTWKNAIVTQAGLELQAALIGGASLVFTRAVAGAGVTEPEELPMLAALADERQALTLQPAETLPGARIRVPATLTSIGLAEGYQMHQIGFYARTGEGDEVLYAVAQDDVGDRVPSEADSPGFTTDWVYVFEYGNAESVTVELDPAGLVSIGRIGRPGGVAGLDDNGAVPIADGGTGAGTVQGALAKLHAKPRENLLVNWDFRRPVNRKGKQTYTESGYTIDGWKIEDQSGKMKCSLVENGIKLELPADASIQAFWTQYFEVLPSETLIASILTEELSGDVRLYLGETIGGVVPADGVYSVLGNIDGSSPLFRVVLQPGSSCILRAAKLELGDTQTLAYQDENGEWQLLEEPDYDEKYLRCCLYSLEDGAFIGLPYSNENLLDNAYWAQSDAIINQRGQTEYTAGGYTIDRWVISSNCVTTVDPNYISIDINKKDTYFFQRFDGEYAKKLGVCTFSVLFTGDSTALAHARIVIFAKSGVLADFVGSDVISGVSFVTLDLSAYSGATIIEMRITSSDVGKTCNAIAAKLEQGSVQTLARQDAAGNWVLIDPPPDKGMELAKCQRYFIRYYGQSILGCGVSYSAEGATIQVSLPVPMRTTPSVVENGDIKLASAYDTATFSKIFVAYLSQNEITLDVISKNLTIGRVSRLNLAEGSYLDFNADL